MKGVPKSGMEFVESLKKCGYQVYMPLEFRSYEIIENEIDQCAGLVALVDEYWTSSTWKASELTYALNGMGAFNVISKNKPLPTFIFWNKKPLNLPFLQNLNKPIFLSQNVNKAIDEFNQYFLNKNRTTSGSRRA